MIQELIPEDALEVYETMIYSLYCDLAYIQSIYIFGGCKHPVDGPAHALWNSEMSKFLMLLSGLCKYSCKIVILDFRAALKII